MAVLTGLPTRSMAGAYAAPAPAAVADASASNTLSAATAVIDGTPIRVVVLALSAAAGLMALHVAGFRFNVGVSG